MVNIIVKNDYYAYITCDNIKIFELLKQSFTRKIKKYNNYYRMYEDKVCKHYTIVNKDKTIKVKAGLVDFLLESLKLNDIQYRIEDNRSKFKIKEENIVTKLGDNIELRYYQEEAVRAAIENKFCCIQLMTGSGKSVCSASIIKTYLNSTKNKGVLYIVPTIKLQKEAKLIFENCGMKCNIKLPLEENVINIITYMALVRSTNISNEERKNIGLVIEDECFTPDTEILTDRGFIRFDELEDENVAQIDDNYNISFTQPIRKIKRYHDGEIEHLEGCKFDFYMTKGHNQPLLIDNKLVTLKAEDLTMFDGKQHTNIKLITSGKGTGSEYKLTWVDRLACILQADGSVLIENKDNIDYWVVMFKRTDKIERFKEILNNCPNDISYVQLKTNQENLKRYEISVPKHYNLSKHLNTHFNLQDKSELFAKDFMNELLYWDVYFEDKYPNCECYLSTEKNNIDFVQAMAVLANYKTFISAENEDQKSSYRLISTENEDQKSSYIPVYKLYWYTQAIFENVTYKTKTTEYYKGDVYCVEVPTHKIIIRRQGKVIVSGNCHHLKGEKASNIIHGFNNLDYNIGLSATITPDIQYKKQLKQLNNDDFDILGCTGRPVYWKSIEKTIEEKFVTPIEIRILNNTEIVQLPDAYISDWQTVKKKVLMSPNRASFIAESIRQICNLNKYSTLMVLIPEVIWSEQFMLEIALQGNQDYRYILMFGKNKFKEVIDSKLVELVTDEQKEEAYNAIKNPDVKTIFSATSFAYEGLDIPNLQALVNIYGGRSDTRIKQQIGRTCRLFKGKNTAHIYEVHDKNPVCISQLKKRLSVYKKEYNAEITNYI